MVTFQIHLHMDDTKFEVWKSLSSLHLLWEDNTGNASNQITTYIGWLLHCWLFVDCFVRMCTCFKYFVCVLAVPGRDDDSTLMCTYDTATLNMAKKKHNLPKTFFLHMQVLCAIQICTIAMPDHIWTFEIINLSIIFTLWSAVFRPLQHTASHGGLSWSASLGSEVVNSAGPVGIAHSDGHPNTWERMSQ